MMAVHWVAGRLFTPSGVTKRVGQFVVGLHLVRRSRSVGPGTDCVGLFPGGRLRRLARAWARRRGGRLQSRVSSRLLCGPCASRWGMSESGQGSARRDGACPKVDKGLRVAMGHVRKWTRGCAWRWGMSESGQGSARGDGACPKVDKGLRAAMGHVRKWTRVCAWRWCVFGIGSDGASSRCHHVDRGLAASDSMYAAD